MNATGRFSSSEITLEDALAENKREWQAAFGRDLPSSGANRALSANVIPMRGNRETLLSKKQLAAELES